MAEVLVPERDAVEEQSQLEQLITYLRGFPFRFDHDREQLAKRFDLSPEFVSDVLDTLRGSPHTGRTADSVKKTLSVIWSSVSTFLKSFNNELTEKPLLAIPVTTLVAVALMLSVKSLGDNGWLGNVQQTQSALLNFGTITIGTLLVLHFLVYLRHGMMRYAAYGSLVFMAISAVVLVWTNGNRPIPNGGNPIQGSEASVFLVFVSIFLASLYFVFASVVSLTGGFLRTSRADRREKKLTRQELIDRLFHLQERLKAVNVKQTKRRRGSLVETLRLTPWLPIYSLLFGLAIGAFTVFMRSTLGVAPSTVDAHGLDSSA